MKRRSAPTGPPGRVSSRAAKLGTNLFKMDPRDLSKKLAAMSEAERDALAQGFTAYVTSLPVTEARDFARSLVSAFKSSVVACTCGPLFGNPRRNRITGTSSTT